MDRKEDIPVYWKSNLEDIDKAVADIRKGKVRTVYSAGNRPIYLVEYGQKNDYHRTANFSSACGSHDIRCYADKTGEDICPCLLLVGATHGAEFEGTVAILNLIKILETGTDYSDRAYPEFDGLIDKINLVMIPCLNPDGRARVPFDTVRGMSFEEFRYYAQGTWKDGTLAGWPECKRIHPILDAADHLGAYYNDDGINIQHDDFFNPMAKETKFVLDIVDEFVPDATILLHGGTNAANQFLQPTHVPLYLKEETRKLEVKLHEACEREGLYTNVHEVRVSDYYKPFYVDLVSAISMKCGELCITYETNQGLAYGNRIQTYDEIYRHHIILFREMIDYVQSLK